MDLALATMFAGAPAADAQQTAVDSFHSVYGNTVDTVTNGATKYMYSPQIRGFQKVISVVVHLAEISGTTAGTITLEASLSGGTSAADWYPVTSYGVTDSTKGTWTFTPTDVASQNFRFKVTDWSDLYLRVKYTGTGTMSDKIYAYYLARREVLSTLYQ